MTVALALALLADAEAPRNGLVRVQPVNVIDAGEAICDK